METISFADFEHRFPTTGDSTKSVVFVIGDGVYDVTSFVAEHPGGPNILRRQHGTDATATFRSMGHSLGAVKIMEKYRIASIQQKEEGESTKQGGAAVATNHDDQPETATETTTSLSVEDAAEAAENDRMTTSLFNGMFRGRLTPNVTGSVAGTGGATTVRGGRLDVVKEVIRQRDIGTDDSCGIPINVRRAIDENYERAQRGESLGQEEAGPPTTAPDLRIPGDANYDASAADLAAKHETGVCSMPKQCYGSQWHAQRRQAILATHPALKDLVETKHFFPLTIFLGFFAALLHFRAIFYWLPNLLRWAAGEQSKIAAGDPQGRHFSLRLIMHGPGLYLPTVNPFGSGFLTFMFGTVSIFILAYTLGAWCKMVSFGVGHEIAHETIHPFISVLGTPHSKRGFLYCVRFVLKDLCLRLCCLPSIGATIFEYYHNQHISHHQYLGGKEFGINLRRLLDGTQSGDGDAMSVNTLMFKQRFLDHVQYHPPLDSRGWNWADAQAQQQGVQHQPVAVQFVIKSLALDEQLRNSARAPFFRFLFAANPILTRVVVDPIFHLGHFVLTFSGVTVQILAVPAHLLLVFLAATPGCIHMLLLKVLFCLTPRRHTVVTQRQFLIHRSSWWEGAKAVWPQASVGVQQVLSIVLLLSLYHFLSSPADAVAVGSGKDQLGTHVISNTFVDRHPVVTFLVILWYATLSELFVFGFLFHPFLAYFLSVHQSHYGTESSAVTDRMTCQPTRSIYSTWLSLCTCNLTHHVEHHDFPSLPWFYLPNVRKLAPDWYDNPSKNAGLSSCWEVIRGYIRDPTNFIYGCSDQFDEEFGAPKRTTIVYK